MYVPCTAAKPPYSIPALAAELLAWLEKRIVRRADGATLPAAHTYDLRIWVNFVWHSYRFGPRLHNDAADLRDGFRAFCDALRWADDWRLNQFIATNLEDLGGPVQQPIPYEGFQNRPGRIDELQTALRLMASAAEFDPPPAPWDAPEPAIVRLVGDLMKALREGLRPEVTVSAVSLGPSGDACTPEMTFPHGDDQSKWNSLDRLKSLLVGDGGMRPEVLEQWIGRVAFHLDLSQARVLNMPLADFVQAMRAVKGQPVATKPTPATAPTSNSDAGLAALVANGGVTDLLALLWHAPDREAGLAVRELPEHLQRDAVLVPCEGFGLIQFARRNYVTKGPDGKGSIILEPGWNVAHLDRPDRKTPSALVQEALTEQVDDRVRLRVRLTRQGQAHAGAAALSGQSAAAGDSSPTQAKGRPAKPKGSTERGEAQAKIVGSLNEHHGYANGSCLVYEPIGVRALAKKAKVGPGSVSEFFTAKFKSHTAYKHGCADKVKFNAAMQLLNGDILPKTMFYGRSPDAGRDGDDE